MPLVVIRLISAAYTRHWSCALVGMLETIAIALVFIWLLGLVFSQTLGGAIHLLLVIAFIAIAVRLIRGRDPLT
jgi:hypothetical protein